MPEHRSIKELVAEANNYEYSDTVPLKVYLRTAETLSRHADLYHDGKSYDDAYILYLRFLDLLMNRIPKHPGLKKDQTLYKSYRAMVSDKAPHAFKNAEIVKNVLVEHNAADARYMALLEENKRMQKEVHAKQQQRLAMEEEASLKNYVLDENMVVDDIGDIDDIDDIDDDQLTGQLNTLMTQQSGTDGLTQSTAYPALPEHHELLISSDNSSTLPPPSLPAKPVPSMIIDQSIHPVLPPKHNEPELAQLSISDKLHRFSQTLHLPRKTPEHKSIASTEGGKPLKTVYLPSEIETKFLSFAQLNTSKKLETCGILCGKLSLGAFFITTLVIPEQESTENTCQTNDEEALFEYVDNHDLFVLGWIHTHPTQSCFLSSVDLHTQNAYQIMLPEAMAIVCAPSADPNFGIFRLTDPPGIGIVTQCHRSGFHPHPEADLYKRGEKRFGGHVVTKEGLPFTSVDLRKKS